MDRDAVPPVYRVGIVNLTPADEAVFRSIAGEDPRAIPYDVRYSWRQLEEMRDSVTRVINSSFPDVSFIIAPDAPSNRVVVTVDRLSRRMAAAVAASGVDQAQVTYEQDPRIQGGLKLE